MTIEYTLTEEDFLTHQLYIASTSERIKKKRRNTRIVIPVLYIGLGLFFLSDDNSSLSVFFIVFGCLWYFVYPEWERKRYIRHYKSFINENYSERINRPASLTIDGETLITSDQSSESRVKTEEIKQVTELPFIMLITLKTGVSLIVSKTKVQDTGILITRLRELAAQLNVPYVQELNWTWK